MPIPSLASALRPRKQIGKATDAPLQAESARPVAPTDPLPPPSTANRPKRRSLLPQRGALPPLARTNTTESASVSTTSRHASTQEPKQARLRPRSLYQTNVTRVDQRSDEKASAAPSGGLSRTQSLRKPTAHAQPVQSANTRSHLRAQSTSTVGLLRNGPTNARTRSERPKSLVVPNGAASVNGTGTADGATTAIRSSTRLAALKRSESVRTRTEVVASSEPSGAAARAGEPLVSDTSRRLGLKEEPTKKLAKPAFTTLQQHFTPRKTGKAPTASFLHPVTDGSAHSQPSEIVGLQAELLQLHLLHEASAEANRRWELSAKNSLRERFEEVASLYQVMRETERQGQEQKNLQSLRDWNSSNPSSGLVEHIQVLSGPLHELPSLVDAGGRLQRLVDGFDRWASWVEDVWTTREGDVGQRGGDLGSIEGLGDSWKAENAALTRKLTAFSRDLDILTRPASDSSIACIITTCRDLLRTILEELHVMQTIEEGVVAKETKWVEDCLQAIARDIGPHLEETAKGNESWRL